MNKKENPLDSTDEKTDDEVLSHQPVDELSTKTETDNDMKHNMSCEECYLAPERIKKELSHM